MSGQKPDTQTTDAKNTVENTVSRPVLPNPGTHISIQNNPDYLETILPYSIQSYKDIDTLPKDGFHIPVMHPDGEVSTFKVPSATWSEKRRMKKILRKATPEQKISYLKGSIMFNKPWETYILISHIQANKSEDLNFNTTSSAVSVPGSISVGMSEDTPLLSYAGKNKTLICMMTACGADVNAEKHPRAHAPLIFLCQENTTESNLIQFYMSLGATLETEDFKYIKHAHTLDFCKALIGSEEYSPKTNALPAAQKNVEDILDNTITKADEQDNTEQTKETVRQEDAQISQPQNTTEEISSPTNFSTLSITDAQNLSVTLPSGRVETIKIPAPDESDIKWAKTVHTLKKSEREKQASSAITSNNLWRLALLLETAHVYNAKMNNDIFLDINCRGISDSDLTLLGHTTLSQGNDDAAVLMLAYGADPEQGTNRRWTPLINAIHNNNLGLVALLLENGAKIFAKDFTAVEERSNIQDYIAEKFGHLIHNNPYQNLNDAALLKANELEGITWTKINDYTIAQTTYTPHKARLNKIFNFRAQDVERFTESLNNNRTVTAVSNSIVQNFTDLSVKDEIRDAHRELSAQDGKIEPLSTYLNHTRRIQKRPS